MTRIKQSENIHPSYAVAAKCYHQGKGCSRIRVPRMYMVSDNQAGLGGKEYLLTRYESKLGVAMSAILEVKGSIATGLTVEAVCYDGRKQEEQMIIDFCRKAGVLGCPESLT